MSTAQASRTASVQRQDVIVTSGQCAMRPYLALTIPDDIKRVTRLSVRISSHDQGFCDDPNGGHWSYLHITVVTSSGRERFSAAPGRWPIRFDNEIGSFAYGEHRLDWDLSNADPFVQTVLRSLRPGDRVQIIPIARFHGWLTYVGEATIEVSGDNLAQSTVGESISNAPMTTVSPFRPLEADKNEIRLLRLRSGTWEDSVSCDLEHMSLGSEQHITYEALSYCWGDTPHLTAIKLTREDNSSAFSDFFVGENLYRALRQLRRGVGQDDRVLWIDAICINQDDPGERTQQVGLMRTVYSLASAVLVWLGPCNAEMQAAIDSVFLIMDHHNEKDAALNEAPVLPKIHDIKESPWVFSVYTPLLGLEYYCRTWVLQEVYNARKVTVYCGKNELSWEAILRVNNCVSRLGLKGISAFVPKMPALFSGLFELGKYERGKPLQYTRKAQKAGILDVFIDGLSLGATDPRDKIYALLSFGAETSSSDELPTLVAPNYAHSVRRVYAEFTLWWIKEHSSLRILSAIHLSIGRTWHLLGPVTTFPKADRASWSLWHDGLDRWSRASLALNTPFPWYQASSSTSPDLSLLEDSSAGVLKLRGRLIAFIEHIDVFPYFTEYIQGATSLPDEMMQAYELLLDPLSMYGTWNPGPHDLETLERDGLGAYRSDQARVVDHYFAHQEFAMQTAGVGCQQPCRLKTFRGDYGLCSPEACVGDAIVVLDGGKVPFILRAVENDRSSQTATASHYILAGECYLQGYMRGEAYQPDANGNNQFQSTVFNLI